MLLNTGEPLSFKETSLCPDLDKLPLYLDLNKLWSLCCHWTHLVWNLIWLLYSSSVLGIHSIISISIYLIHWGSLSDVTESMLSYHWQFSCHIVSPSIFSCTPIPCSGGACWISGLASPDPSVVSLSIICKLESYLHCSITLITACQSYGRCSWTLSTGR